jgi:hypothetical protein
MRSGRVLLLLLLPVVAALVAALAGPVPAASAATPTTLVLQAPPQYAGTVATLQVRLRTSAGAPVEGAAVEVERRVDGAWQQMGVVVTDAAGDASLSLRVARRSDDNRLRASYAGDASYDPAAGEGVLPLRRRDSVVSLAAPARVADGSRVTLAVQWRTGEGQPVSGTVLLERRAPGAGRWGRVGTVRTGEDGRGSTRVRPRADSIYRARVTPTDWTKADTSPGRRIDHRPPGRPVDLPRGAPAPRVRLPRQEPATGRGANAAITPIPDGVWSQMAGRSWHAGCPVGRTGLRLVRVNHWGFDGYRYRGELVAATDAADNMAGALAEMYARRLPIRAMHRVDRFGWSGRLQGADDYRSMAAGNTSAFNCRWVVGRPGTRSPHAYGRSLDVNPWENPFHSSHGVVPNGWWAGRSHPQVAWRSRAHAVVRLMARHGLRWTYGSSDSQHFDVVGSARLAARSDLSPRLLHPQCGTAVCE